MIKTIHDTAIVVNDASRHFGKTTAIDHVNLSVNQGELFGVLGPDGAGKTTLLRMMAAVMNPSNLEAQGLMGRISGMFHPPTGHVTVAGFDTVSDSEQVKARLGYMPQAFGLYGDLSVDENLTFAADVFGVMGQERENRLRELIAFAGLEQFRNRRAEVLSGGMKKKLALACALLHRPEVLLLDEPTTGVDPVARRDFWDLLSGLHSEGITVLVTTPYMDEAERCNRVMLLFEGQVLAEGTPQEIKSKVKGQVLVVRNIPIHEGEKLLGDLPQVIEVQSYGHQLNLIIDGDAQVIQPDVQRHLEAAGFKQAQFETMPIRMEEAFIYLVNAAKGRQS